MKTNGIRNTVLAVIMVVAGIFSASANNSNDFFFDKKTNESGKMISKTKYEFVQKGLAHPRYMYEYSYDESGKLIKSDFLLWSPNSKEWKMSSSITYTYLVKEQCVEVKYMTWNQKESKYNPVSEKAIYWYDNSGNVVSYYFDKGNINIFEEFTLTN